MISIKNLEISYTKDKIIINDLNLELKENKIHGIVGLNGSGKTTLLNSVFGLKKQSKGEILINGQKASKKEIAYLTSENYFYKNITAREYLNIFKSDDFNIEKWNELFELPLDNIIDNFSTRITSYNVCYTKLLRTILLSETCSSNPSICNK